MTPQEARQGARSIAAKAARFGITVDANPDIAQLTLDCIDAGVPEVEIFA
jgi:hypothetical protein